MLVEAKVPGSRGAGFEPRVVDGVDGSSLAVRDLVGHVVRAEVRAFGEREAQRSLIRVLSRDEIDAGASQGKVDLGGRSPTGPVDVDAAVATAHEAFEDGIYLVFVDGEQRTSLDDEVQVDTDTCVRFVRLTALAGG